MGDHCWEKGILDLLLFVVGQNLTIGNGWKLVKMFVCVWWVGGSSVFMALCFGESLRSFDGCGALLSLCFLLKKKTTKNKNCGMNPFAGTWCRSRLTFQIQLWWSHGGLSSEAGPFTLEVRKHWRAEIRKEEVNTSYHSDALTVYHCDG